MAFIVAAHRSAETRRIVASALARAGHTVVLFADGGRALAEIYAGMPDAVVLDDHLDGMSGLEVRAAMRSCPSLAGIPAVLCSATLAPSEISAHLADGDLTVRPAMLATDLGTAVAGALTGPGRPLVGATR